MITGYAEQMGLQDAEGLCLAKPFSVAVLLRKVRQVLDIAKAMTGAKE